MSEAEIRAEMIAQIATLNFAVHAIIDELDGRTPGFSEYLAESLEALAEKVSDPIFQRELRSFAEVLEE